MLFENIKKLVEYGIQTGLTPECERIFTTNHLLEIFKEDNMRIQKLILKILSWKTS